MECFHFKSLKLAIAFAVLTIQISKFNQVNSQATECLFSGCRCLGMNDTFINIECIGNNPFINTNSNNSSNTTNDFYLGYDFPTRLQSSTLLNKPIRTLLIANFNFAVIPSMAFDSLNITNLHFRNNSLRALNVTSFSGLNGLTGLLFMNEKFLTEFEIGCFNSSLKDTLRVFSLIGSNLDDARLGKLKDELKTLTRLEHLNLSSNNLTVLDRDLLSNYKELTIVDFSRNKISNHSINVFELNPKLSHVNLSNNQLSDLFLFLIAIIRQINVIEAINLNGNNFTSLFDIIANFRNLKELHMANNKIQTNMDMFLFKSLDNLTHLNLSGNMISFLDSNTFMFTPSLKLVDLSSNLLSILPDLSNLTMLSTFSFANQDVRHVEIRDFAFDKRSPANLTALSVDISGNRLSFVATRPFCSRQSSWAAANFINSIRIDFSQLVKIEKCVLAQLTSSTDGNNVTRKQEVILDVSDPDAVDNDRNDFKRYRALCNCEYAKFMQANNIRLAGVCSGLNVTACEELIQVDDCDDFSCSGLIGNLTTPSGDSDDNLAASISGSLVLGFFSLVVSLVAFNYY